MRIAKLQDTLGDLEKEVSAREGGPRARGGSGADVRRAAQDDFEATKSRGLTAVEDKEQSLKVLYERIETAVAYRETLMHMLARYRKESENFDSTVEAFSKALNMRQEEAKEVMVLAKQAKQMRDADVVELKRLSQMAREEVERWQAEVEQREKVAAQRENMLRWYQMQESSRERVEDIVAKDLTYDDANRRLARATAAAVSKPSQDARKEEAHRERAQFEEAFNQIKMVTGLTQVDDIVERYNGRDKELLDMRSQIEALKAKLARIKTERDEKKGRLQELKFGHVPGVTADDRDRQETLNKLRLRACARGGPAPASLLLTALRAQETR